MKLGPRFRSLGRMLPRSRDHCQQARSKSPWGSGRRLGRKVGILLVLLISGALHAMVPFRAMSQVPDPDLWTTDGNVYAVVKDGNTVFVGGDYGFLGPRTGGGAPVRTDTGQPIRSLPWIQGSIYCALPDGSGGWFVGGSFFLEGDSQNRNIAHVLPDGAVDDWNPQVNDRSAILAMAVGEGTLYIGGEIQTVGGQARSNLAAVDLSTAAVLPWNPSPNYQVYTLAVDGPTVYAGGRFTNIGGVPRNHIAALDSETGASTDWDPDIDGNVYAAIPVGGIVYIGGAFDRVGAQTRRCIAAVDVTSGAATAWDPDAGGLVRSLGVGGASVYVGGDFQGIGGEPRDYLAEISTSTGHATAWDPAADGPVETVAIAGSTIYAGGDFLAVGGQPRWHAVAIDLATGDVRPWTAHANARVRVLVEQDGVLYVGGEFGCVGGVLRDRIAALDARTGVATSWDPQANLPVYALAVDDNTVYAGGSFTMIGGEARCRIAAIERTTGLATPWNPGANRDVNTLSLARDIVYAGGAFTVIGTQPRNRIAALDGTSGSPTSWDPNANGSVAVLRKVGNRIYAGGTFTSIGGQERHRLAALDVGSGLATAWNPDADGMVSALATSGGVVYAGGLFSAVGGEQRTRLAAMDAGTGVVLPWTADLACEEIWSVSLYGSTLYVGGITAAPQGSPYDIGALDARTGLCLPWNPYPYITSLIVTAIDVKDGMVYVGGDTGNLYLASDVDLLALVPFVGGFEGFRVVEPADGDSVPGTSLAFRWSGARVSDPENVMRYTLYWSEDADFALPDSVGAGGDTTVTLPDGALVANQTYYWKVRAFDEAGNECWSSPADPWGFYVLPDEGTAVLPLLSASELDGGVLVSCSLPRDIDALGFSVYRRTEGEDWICLIEGLPASDGSLEYLDAGAVPGVLYEYEVEVFGSVGPVGRWGPVAYMMPEISILSFRVRPHPGTGQARLDFRLPQAGDVMLRVFDPAGREVAGEEWPNLPAGRHDRVWEAVDRSGSPLGSGLYWLRLETATEARTVRWTVVR